MANHTNKTQESNHMSKIYPYNYGEELRAAGLHDFRLMWEIKGPRDTDIAWITCWVVRESDHNVCVHIIETFKSGGRLVLREHR